MKKQRMIATAVFTAALAAAMAFPAFAASMVEVEILQADEPPDEEPLTEVVVVEEAPAAQTAADQPESQPSTGRSAQAVPAQQSVSLSAQQQAVILELIPDDIYRFYTSMLWDQVPETSVDISAISDQDMANEFYGVLRNAGEGSVIYTPVEHEAVEGYSVWFDKDDALSKTAGLYGRGISESAITTYNNEWGGDMPDMIAIDDDALAPLDPDGEGKIYPSIGSCVSDGDDLTISISFTATFDDPKNNGSGLATAVFTSDDQSPIGYRLKSIALD